MSYIPKKSAWPPLTFITVVYTLALVMASAYVLWVDQEKTRGAAAIPQTKRAVEAAGWVPTTPLHLDQSVLAALTELFSDIKITGEARLGTQCKVIFSAPLEDPANVTMFVVQDTLLPVTKMVQLPLVSPQRASEQREKLGLTHCFG